MGTTLPAVIGRAEHSIPQTVRSHASRELGPGESFEGKPLGSFANMPVMCEPRLLPDAADTRAEGRRPDRQSPSTWLPVRRLQPAHRPRMRSHLLALDERDRWLRFGFAASDARIAGYVDQIDFGRDVVLGIFDRRLRLVALAHLACPAAAAQALEVDHAAEFGVSVLARHRGRGMGQHLFDLAALHARNRGVDALRIQALVHNDPMLAIARRAGAAIEVDGSEATAVLRLPTQGPVSKLQQHWYDGLGEADYGFKRNRRRAQGLWTGWCSAGPRGR